MYIVTRIKCGNSNCFCLEQDGNAILIDTSRTEYSNKIFNECNDKNIRLIVLTHGHIDHIQNAAALSKALKAPIAMHRADYSLSINNMEEPMSADVILGKFMLALIQKDLKYGKAESFEPDVFLCDGDTLDSYGLRANIIELPGHTKGSIGIVAGDEHIFVGDALMNIIYPVKSLLYGNKADMLMSVDKISSFKNATVHFGHGKSLKNKIW